MHTASMLVYLYATLVVLGGLFGFLKAKSLPSLIMGGVGGLALIAAGVALGHGLAWGLPLAFVLSAGLLVFFSQRRKPVKMCLSVILPALLLVGCSHTRPIPVAVAIPKPVLKEAIVPAVSEAPPGALAHWKASSVTVYCFAFSPDGKQLTTVSEGNQVKIWTIANRQLSHSFQAADDGVWDITYSPNGRWIAAIGYKKELSFIDIFNAHTRHLILRLPLGFDRASALHFSHDSNFLFAADKKIRIWDTKTWRNLYHLKTDDSAMLIPNGQRFVRCSTDGVIRVCDARTGRIVKTWREVRGADDHRYTLQSISNDGRALMVSKY